MALTTLGLAGPGKSYGLAPITDKSPVSSRISSASPLLYKPGLVPHKVDDLHRFLQDEFNYISDTIRLISGGHLEPTYSAPAKPKDGDFRYADGTMWDPGSGEGFYVFFNGNWNVAASIPAYAQLSSTANQVPVNTNPVLVTFNTDDEIYGITHNTGVVTTQTSGIYQFIYGAQVAKTGSGASDTVWIWLRRNGVDVPRSAVATTITNQADSLAALLNYTGRLAKGETIELYQKVSATTRFPGLYASAPAGIPIVPSVILSVNKFA